jgi:phytoene desaturase
LAQLGGWRSVHELVARYIKDPRLRVIFSYHPLLIGGNSFSASAIYCLIAFLERRWGVHCVIGGTGRLIAGMAGLIAGHGGVLRHGAEIARLFLVGAGTHPGAGVPGVLSSARVLDRVVPHGSELVR